MHNDTNESGYQDSGYEEKKRFLKRYSNQRNKVDMLSRRLDALRDRITSIRSPIISGMPRGGTPVTVADLIADQVDLEERIERGTEKAREIKREIIDYIDLLDNPDQIEVLESRFIGGISFENIAEEMGYSSRYVITLHRKGLDSLPPPPVSSY